MTTTSRWRVPLALALVFTFVLAACGSDDSDSEGATDTTAPAIEGTTIQLAPQDFAESKTLTEVYGQFLQARGFDVEIQPASGFRDQVYPGLSAGDISLIIDYSGSAARFLDQEGTPSSDADETYATLTTVLDGEGLVAADFSPAEDARTRADCLLGYQDVYGLEFADFVALEYGPPLTEALSADEVQVAQYQTTAPQLASGDFVELEDDKGLLSADNVVPVLTQALADEYGDTLLDALNELSALITTADLVDWNVSTDIDKDEPADVATAWLQEEGLI
jgi:osmoprotectant transport system substrate-binding protein